MVKRIGLFLLTNLLVVVTVGIIMNVILPYFGIKYDGWISLAVFCGVFGMSGAIISLLISRFMAKTAYRIRIIKPDEQDYQLREIYQMTANLARKAGLPKTPEVGVYESQEPNAFATGPTKSKALIAFSTGLLNSMDKQEVEAVAGHEMSHITNGDMVTMALLTGVANALVMFLSRTIAFAINNALRGEDGRGGLGYFAYIIVVMALDTVFMMLASIPIAAFSRYREYRADAGSAKLTTPSAMANALEALSKASDIATKKDNFAIAKISSNRRTSLWATHPSLESRIDRLRKMA